MTRFLKWRKMTWALLLWGALIGLWMVSGTFALALLAGVRATARGFAGCVQSRSHSSPSRVPAPRPVRSSASGGAARRVLG